MHVGPFWVADRICPEQCLIEASAAASKAAQHAICWRIRTAASVHRWWHRTKKCSSPSNSGEVCITQINIGSQVCTRVSAVVQLPTYRLGYVVGVLQANLGGFLRCKHCCATVSQAACNFLPNCPLASSASHITSLTLSQGLYLGPMQKGKGAQVKNASGWGVQGASLRV